MIGETEHSSFISWGSQSIDNNSSERHGAGCPLTKRDTDSADWETIRRPAAGAWHIAEHIFGSHMAPIPYSLQLEIRVVVTNFKLHRSVQTKELSPRHTLSLIKLANTDTQQHISDQGVHQFSEIKTACSFIPTDLGGVSRKRRVCYSYRVWSYNKFRS